MIGADFIRRNGSRMVLFATALVGASVCSAGSAPGSPVLLKGFESPPRSAEPRVWWHWMNGNVTERGIGKDLAWMHGIGIGGVNVIPVSLLTPQIVERPLIYMSPSWKRAFRDTSDLTARYEMELSIDSSPGWSETGGPWVKPSQGMKKLVWSSTVVDGGRPFDGVLPLPPSNTGPFQDAPMVGGLGGLPKYAKLKFYRDALVVAYPALGLDPLPATASSSAGVLTAGNLAELADQKLTGGISIAAKGGQAYIQLRYAKPVVLQGVTLAASASGLPGVESTVFVSSNAVSWKQVAVFSPANALDGGAFPQETESFAPTTVTYVRVVLRSASPAGIFNGPFTYNAPGAVPVLAQLQALAGPGYKPLAPVFQIHALVMHSTATVNQFEAKADFRIVSNYYALDARVPIVSGSAVSPHEVVNLTRRMSSDGALNWTPPPGRWVILRMGYSLEGTTNHPASAEATGLEVDKLSRRDVEAYMEHYLGEFHPIVGSFGSKSLGAFTVDSTEVGMQNWTPNFVADFERSRGYDPIPWFPALTGVVVGSPSNSDKFLWDYRHVIQQLLARNHYEEIQRVSSAAGLVTYGEALESHRPTFGDDMEMRQYTDIPMGAMWMYPPGKSPEPTYVADLKGAASVAHVYGKRLVGAESLDSVDQPWAFAPQQLKRVVDKEFLLGVNRVVIHESAEQPVDRPPGISVAFFGQMFNRLETWAPEAGPWIRYISRCSYLLQQGKYVADIAYFYGQEAPITGIFGDRRIDVPEGYGFDFVDQNALMRQLSVMHGDLVTPSGMSYRVLYLGGTSRWMTLEVLRRIASLVRAGATIVGKRPIGSPSLRDSNAEFQALAQELFGSPDRSDVRDVGRGKVFGGGSLPDALKTLGLQPEFEASSVGGSAKVRSIERKLPQGAVFFVSNRSDDSVQVSASFRVTGYAPQLWNPVTGRVEAVDYDISGARTQVPLQLSPYESTFVVFREPARSRSFLLPKERTRTLVTLRGPWRVVFQRHRGAPQSIVLPHLASWTTSQNVGVKYFSGTAIYRHSFDLSRAGTEGRIRLSLGAVRDLAAVRVNGKDVGVSWTQPFVLDISRYVHPGVNTLEIAVTNLWVNRLIGDQQPGHAKKYTFSSGPTYEPNAPLRESGLLGPVRIEQTRSTPQERDQRTSSIIEKGAVNLQLANLSDVRAN